MDYRTFHYYQLFGKGLKTYLLKGVLDVGVVMGVWW
jgi:hypothetical protein